MYSWWWVELTPETCRVKPLRRINAIVASCWTYFTTIKHDARNHKYYALNVSYLCVCFFFGCVSLFGVTRLFWFAGAVSSFMAEWRELFDEGKTLNKKLLVKKSRDDLYTEMKGFEIQRFFFCVMFVRLLFAHART